MTTTDMQETAIENRLRSEFGSELDSIVSWWLKHAIDHEHGGFVGEISRDNTVVAGANKGVVLHSRLLWFFSEAAAKIDSPQCRKAAHRAYQYLVDHFIDREFGGVYWELDARGNPVDTKKQVYAQAFTVYALASYHKLSDNLQALNIAVECFDLMELHAVDREKDGYLEAFSREWGALKDVRLSQKDLNFPKTMNTHLHVLEAYTSLHQVAPTSKTEAALRYTIECFDKHIIDHDSSHLRMFMDDDWTDHSTSLSYGHDIESSWLLMKALDAVSDTELSEQLLPAAIRLGDTCLAEAIGENGEVIDAYDLASNTYCRERVWWVQAEALVGFIKLYSITSNQKYLDAANEIWDFIKNYQLDEQYGEWFWHSRLDSDYSEHYKAGFWKCPYHNGRALLESGTLLRGM